MLRNRMVSVPYGNHVVVHPLELPLCRLEGIWGRIEFVGLEALIGQPDFERCIIFLFA